MKQSVKPARVWKSCFIRQLFYQAVVRSGSTKAIQVEVGPLCCLQRYSDQTSAHRVVA